MTGVGRSSEVEHEITVAAPAAAVYRLIAEVGNWPRIFPPTIHVEHVERGETEERIRIWATANGEVRNWVSRRVLDPAALRIEFRQEVSPPPIASMGGAWVIEPRGEAACRLRLLHDYRAIDDDPADLAGIAKAVDTNSRSELAALKANLEAATRAEELTFSFEDTVRIDASAQDVFDFVNEADRWAERLPHVASVRLDEPAPGLQTLEMETRAKDGSTHVTKSYRVCLPAYKIAYKQVTLPALMALHTGYWTFRESGPGVLASSQHTVVLNPDNLADGMDVETAKKLVRDALSTNSTATLNHAKSHAEAGR
ncbi:aromatase/cyclase [Amycolatopsis sp. NPDC098790]|uniref:aromatase/cyclase n=1 Tax=Amycolatopsis sp. NPDC098790 TaxID=3363939 RepID=UPI0038247AA8